MHITEDKRLEIVCQTIREYNTAYGKAHFGSPTPRKEKDILQIAKTSIYKILREDAQRKCPTGSVDEEVLRKEVDTQTEVIAQWLPLCMDLFLWSERRL